ncbi:MAG: hypothetical protein AB7G39_04415 [Alphaproteobacteria bacterium]
MKKSPVLWSVLIGLAAGGLTVGLSKAFTAGWSLPPDMTNLMILGVIVGGVVGRCAFMALEPRNEAEPERS